MEDLEAGLAAPGRGKPLDAVVANHALVGLLLELVGDRLGQLAVSDSEDVQGSLLGILLLLLLLFFLLPVLFVLAFAFDIVVVILFLIDVNVVVISISRKGSKGLISASDLKVCEPVDRGGPRFIV